MADAEHDAERDAKPAAKQDDPSNDESRSLAPIGDGEAGEPADERAADDEKWRRFHERSYEAGKTVRAIALEGAATASEVGAKAQDLGHAVGTTSVVAARAVKAALGDAARVAGEQWAEHREPAAEMGRELAQKMAARSSEALEDVGALAGEAGTRAEEVARISKERAARAADEAGKRARAVYEDREAIAESAAEAAREATKKGKVLGARLHGIASGWAEKAQVVGKDAARLATTLGAEAADKGEKLREVATPWAERGLTASREGLVRAHDVGGALAKDGAARVVSAADVAAREGRSVASDLLEKGRAVAESAEVHAFIDHAKDAVVTSAGEATQGLKMGSVFVASHVADGASAAADWASTDGVELSKAALERGAVVKDRVVETVAESGGHIAKESALKAQELALHVGEVAPDAGRALASKVAEGAVQAAGATKSGAEKAASAAAELSEKGKDVAAGLAGGAKAFWRGVKGE